LRFADGLAVQLKLIGSDPADAAAAELGLEWVAAELAALNATPEDLAKLRSTLDQAATLVDNGRAFAEASQVFHDTVAHASGNWAIISSLRALRELLGESRAVHATPDVARRVQATHEEIYQAIRDRDSEKASRLMRQHLGPIRNSEAQRRNWHGNAASAL
ncbi:MAG: FadR/GntR family transcriptional regulator, partial [Chloroflexota bacterium]